MHNYVYVANEHINIWPRDYRIQILVYRSCASICSRLYTSHHAAPAPLATSSQYSSDPRVLTPATLTPSTPPPSSLTSHPCARTTTPPNPCKPWTSIYAPRLRYARRCSRRTTPVSRWTRVCSRPSRCVTRRPTTRPTVCARARLITSLTLSGGRRPSDQQWSTCRRQVLVVIDTRGPAMVLLGVRGE